MGQNLRAGVCVGAAIFRDDALLLLRRVDDFAGLWELPGGSVEAGEGLEQALAREVTEETGLSVTVGPAFYASTFTAKGSDDRPVTVVAIEFLCGRPNGGAIRLSEQEHDAFAWVRAEQLTSYDLVPAFTPVVPQAFRLHRAGIA